MSTDDQQQQQQQQQPSDAGRLSESFDRLAVNDNGDAAPRTDQEYAESQLTLRAIVSSKEAGVIIGKAGKNVADLRDETGVRAGVSKVVQGVHDRVLSVTGHLEGIAKAYGLVAKGLLEGAPQMGMGGLIRNDGTHRQSSTAAVSEQYCGHIVLKVNMD
jgi:heterogeneous nuclear rnp K-like protein 2